MQVPDDIRRDLPPDLDRAMRESLAAIAIRLQAQRSNPAPSFRGDLRRTLPGKAGRRQYALARLGPRALAFSFAATASLLFDRAGPAHTFRMALCAVLPSACHDGVGTPN